MIRNVGDLLVTLVDGGEAQGREARAEDVVDARVVGRPAEVVERRLVGYCLISFNFPDFSASFSNSLFPAFMVPKSFSGQ